MGAAENLCPVRTLLGVEVAVLGLLELTGTRVPQTAVTVDPVFPVVLPVRRWREPEEAEAVVLL